MISNTGDHLGNDIRLLVDDRPLMPSDYPLDNLPPLNCNDRQLVCIIRETKAVYTPAVIYLPGPIIAGLLPDPESFRRGRRNNVELPEVIALEGPGETRQLPAPAISPRMDLSITTEGRITRIAELSEQVKHIAEIEPRVTTDDLSEVRELLHLYDFNAAVEYLNSCLDAYHNKEQFLHTQDGYAKLMPWVKATAKELGVPVCGYYKRTNTGEAVSRFRVTLLEGQWHLTVDQIVKGAARLSYILVAIRRGVPFEDMREPFINWKFDAYVEFMTGIKPKTREEKEAALVAKKDAEKENPQVLTPTDQEREIVSVLKKGLDAKPIGLNDQSHVPFLQKAQLAYRRELTDIAYEKRDPEFYGAGKICKDIKAIHVLADCKFMFKKHLAAETKDLLVCDVLSAHLNDDPALVVQREKAGYKCTRDYLAQEIGVHFDIDEGIKIGQNYLANEELVLSHLGNIDSEIKLKMLYFLDSAIELQGDRHDLFDRFFRPETEPADWVAFATHRDYEKYLAEKKMSQAKIKKARMIIFEYNEAKKGGSPSSKRPPLAGDEMVIFSIVREEEKSFLDRCLRDPAYLNSYVQKYAWYRDHGYLP